MELHNYFNHKTILITGATGLIGSNLVKRLLQYPDNDMILVGRSKEKLEKVFGHHERIRLVEHDISTPFLEGLGHIDCIYHAASPISGGTIQNEPVSVIKANLDGTLYCLEYLKKQKNESGGDGTMIVFSSATVYGSSIDEDIKVDETMTKSAEDLDALIAPYSESKRMIEVMSRAYARQYGIDVKIARIGYVYGYTPILPRTALYDFLKIVGRGENIVFGKTGFGRRDNIYIDDVIEGLLYITAKGTSSESYNVSSAGDLENFASIDEMAQIIVDAANNGTKVIIQECNQRSGGVILNNTKLKNLGWSVKTSLIQGITNLYKSVNK